MDQRVGGGSVVIERTLGTPAPVGDMLAYGAATGPNRATPLVGVVSMLGGGSASLSVVVAALTSLLVRIGGVWKSSIPYVRVSGAWKQAVPKINISGVWK